MSQRSDIKLWSIEQRNSWEALTQKGKRDYWSAQMESDDAVMEVLDFQG